MPVLSIPAGLSPEKYASKKFRQQTRAARRRFEERGLEPWLQYLRGAETIEPLLPQMRCIRRDRDHDRARRSGLDDGQRVAWWRAVTRELPSRGGMEAILLHVGEEMVGYSLALLDGSTYRLSDGRFHPAHKTLQPDQLMYGELLQRLVGDGHWRRLDLCAGVPYSRTGWRTTRRNAITYEPGRRC